MKIIYLLLFLILCMPLTSCNKKEIENFKEEVKVLKREKDSLQNIVSNINNKYVFDSIFIRTIPSHKNTFKKGSVYEVDIIPTAYNKSNHFIKYDTIIDKKMINPDTLVYDGGIYKYRTKLEKHKQKLSVDILIKNEYGEYFKGTLSDKIPIKN